MLLSRRDRSGFLLLAALALAVGPLGHRHDPHPIGLRLSGEPVYSAGHERPHRALHVESVARVDAGGCPVCTLRQRETIAPVGSEGLHVRLVAARLAATTRVRPVVRETLGVTGPRGPPTT